MDLSRAKEKCFSFFLGERAGSAGHILLMISPSMWTLGALFVVSRLALANIHDDGERLFRAHSVFKNKNFEEQ
jgi:hypothetical protein